MEERGRSTAPQGSGDSVTGAVPSEGAVASHPASRDYPAGVVAFLFTDIEGSTKSWEADARQMRVAVERHFDLLRGAIEAQSGVLFKTVGDAVQAAFPSVAGAVAAAAEGQRAIAAEPWGEPGPLSVRMAIHLGEATPRAGDYLAPSLNRLARLMSAGYGGQILLSHAARSIVAQALPPGLSLLDLGTHRLRDLLDAEPIWQLAGPGLAATFPPLKTLDLARHNLPAQPNALLGREREVEAVRALLARPDVRLVTIVGPGGTGKTPVGLQVAAEETTRFPGGVWFVPLAGVADASFVPAAVAAAAGIAETPGMPIERTLKERLAGSETLLLLDNAEHLPDAAPFVAELLAAVPALRVLVTSRQPLRIAAEREFALDPLAVPPQGSGADLASLLEFPAVRLFVERAEAVRPGFALTSENASAVAAICRQLDGLPLAIELAAARVRVLAPTALLARLDKRLKLLTGGARDLPTRQQTLRNTIAWSHDLLDPAERDLFARLAVFAGGCTLEAAEAVCTGTGCDGLDVFEGLDSLVQQSLVRERDGIDGEPRFTMLQTIREFGLEQLELSGQIAPARTAHAAYFLELAEQLDGIHTDPDYPHDQLEAEHDNLRQALATFAAEPDGMAGRVRLAAALWYFWWIRGHFAEASVVLDDVTALLVETADLEEIPLPAQSAAFAGAATMAETRGDYGRATELHERALALRRDGHHISAVADSLTNLGVIALNQGDLDRARRHHEEALALWRSLGDKPGEAGSLRDLGSIHLYQGDYAAARQMLEESLGIFRSVGDGTGEAVALQSLGLLAVYEQRPDVAVPLYEASLRLWRQLGNRLMVAADLGNLGEALALAGDPSRAVPMLNEALALYEELNDLGGRAFALHELGKTKLEGGDATAAEALLAESSSIRYEIGELAGVAESLESLAAARVALGQPEESARLLGAAATLRDTLGVPLPPGYESAHALAISRATELLGDAAFQGLLAEGQADLLEEIVRGLRAPATTSTARTEPYPIGPRR